jgi:hypothetical protein
VITTGGTGITGRDTTPEAVSVLFDKQIDGFGELFRAVSYEEINTSTIQSRAVAGVANATFIFCLPGSTGACRTGWGKLIGHQLDYRTRPCPGGIDAAGAGVVVPRVCQGHSGLCQLALSKILRAGQSGPEHQPPVLMFRQGRDCYSRDVMSSQGKYVII